AWIVLELTSSWAAAIAAAIVFALNPNVLYLQATPMTEPMLLALTTLGTAILVTHTAEDAEDAEPGSSSASPASSAVYPVGIVLALACLTRYEAWPVTASALVLLVWVRWRGGDSWRDAIRDAGSIAIYPAIAVAAFTIFSRVVIGQWVRRGGFFRPQDKALGDPGMAV